MRLVDEQGRLFGRINLIDGAALFFSFFSVALLLHFAYHNILRHTTLTVESVEPAVFVPGVDQVLTIMGNGFSAGTVFKVQGQKLENIHWVNKARMDVKLPEDIRPGSYLIEAEDLRGRKLVAHDLFRVVWKPVVNLIETLERTLTQTIYRIGGGYFESGCRLVLKGSPEVREKYVSSHEIWMIVPAVGPDRPWTELGIRNPSGGETILRGEELLQRMNPEGLSTALPEPKIVRIIPNTIRVGHDTGLVVLGYRFAEGCRIRVGGLPLHSVQFFDSHMAQGILPAHSLPPGLHSVELINPNSRTAVAKDILTAEAESTGFLEVVLRFEGINRKHLNGLYLKNSSLSTRSAYGFRILKILDGGGLFKKWIGRRNHEAKGGVRAKVRLPVEIVYAPDESLQFFYRGQQVRRGATLSISFSWNQAVPALALSDPKLVQETEIQAGS